jgi:hypothetical protein
MVNVGRQQLTNPVVNLGLVFDILILDNANKVCQSFIIPINTFL